MSVEVNDENCSCVVQGCGCAFLVFAALLFLAGMIGYWMAK